MTLVSIDMRSQSGLDGDWFRGEESAPDPGECSPEGSPSIGEAAPRAAWHVAEKGCGPTGSG